MGGSVMTVMTWPCVLIIVTAILMDIRSEREACFTHVYTELRQSGHIVVSVTACRWAVGI